jgi:hypothetical protein
LYLTPQIVQLALETRDRTRILINLVRHVLVFDARHVNRGTRTARGWFRHGLEG